MKKVIEISGMNCDHCKMKVEKALSAVDGVTEVKVNLKKNQAVLNMERDVDEQLLKDAVTEAGFTPGAVSLKKGIF